MQLDVTFARSIIKQSYPYAFLVLLMSIYYRADSILLERILPNGATEAGIYAQAFRILDAFTMVPFLFAGLLLPMFSGMIKREEEVIPLISFASKTLIVPVVAISASCLVYRSEIMSTLYHGHAAESAQVLGVMMITLIFSSVNYIYGTLLTANGSISMLNRISLVGVVVNLGLNLILIPRQYALGAAISAASTQAVVAALQVGSSLKVFNINITKKTVAKVALFGLGSIALAAASHYIKTDWLAQFAISLTAIATYGLAIGLIRIKELWILLVPQNP